MAKAYERGWSDGFHRGHGSGEALAQQNVQRLERRIQELEQRLDDATRIYEIDGDQVVEVGRYAYRWRGDSPLQVGDRVLLPENWLSRVKDGPGSSEGVVTKLGSTYRGALSLIVGRAPSDSV